MCGLAGLILAPRRRSVQELRWVRELFTALLVGNEARGPYATGVAAVQADGMYQVEKAPLSARAFVGAPRYRAWAEQVMPTTTLLMGHTRWPTRGSVRNPANNHPLVVTRDEGSVLLTHNGHLHAVERLFAQWQLPRQAQVDSELLGQLAARHVTPTGLDLPAYLSDLQEITGRMSAVLIATNQPTVIYLFKGNMPLEVVYHPQAQVLAYASELRGRLGAIKHGWEPVPVWAGRVLVVNLHEVMRWQQVLFTFQRTGAE